MTPHACQDSWPRIWRMALALVEQDRNAYDVVLSELGDCPDCLRNALNTAMHQFTGGLVLQAGSLTRSADVAQAELERMLPT
jgi:hypothetical protein